MQIEPIAKIRTNFKEKFGIPRQSGRAPSAIGRIVFEPKFRNPDALREIGGFSHLWLIFDFSLSHKEEFCPTVRPPRLGGNTRVGVFASRSPFRPNALGLSAVKLEGIENTPEGQVLVVSGVDLLDNTPIYDVKPYIPSSDCVQNASGGYSSNHTHHQLCVEFDEALLSKIDCDKQDALIECLRDDPRPSYQDDDRVYSMRYANCDVHFVVEGDFLFVTGIDIVE